MNNRYFAVAGVLIIITGLVVAGNTGLLDKKFSFTGSSSITGVVTDAAIGTAIKNADVVLSSSNEKHKVSTDDNGKYIITKLDAGNYTLTFSAKGYTEKSEHIILSGNELRSIDVTLNAIIELEKTVAKDDIEKEKSEESKNYRLAPLSSTNVYLSSGIATQPDGYYDFQLEEVEFNTEFYDPVFENGFKKIIGNPLSTFFN